ncbi:MAG: methenyltetrahydromethanopterin cyclohydrolase [Candidatus Bathyarchaeota archaeon]|nr:methenyltetrahydromethanopterin cyclohydrolase [Candidatus Bathyarchaeota archaeon]MDH5787498.1 methenyltetrahydromethanopterin cyclohydrolase [Candidatus Bathyarchaeota archaeon]
MKMALSVNRLAWKLLEKLCENPDYCGVEIEKTDAGTTIVDAGIKAKGGFHAGRIVTEICMGGCAKAEITRRRYGDIDLPSIFVYSDYPVIATLGSQFAGWQIKEGDYFAIGSGPARALALKPKEIYEKIDYKDNFDKAIVVLETDKRPPEKLVERLTKDCHVSAENLAIVLTPTASIAGATQVSGRIVETGIHKLNMLGLDPKTILHAWGHAPIPPIHPKFVNAMARTNDAILFGGVSYYIIEHEDEEKLETIVNKAPSSASKDYGKPFIEIFKRVNYDFYKIDSNLFAPAIVIINNIKTGRIFERGEINTKALAESFGFKPINP